MSNLLWQKPGVEVDAAIQEFLAGEDVVLDREFLLFDIRASRAHAEGLQRIGILTAAELAALQRELELLADDFSAGRFVLDSRFEDCHSAIEARLTERLGDAGRKIHTGRSRNDQILVATRLWLKDRLARVADLCLEAARGRAVARGSRGCDCPCPATRTCSAPWSRRPACGGRPGPRASSTMPCAPGRRSNGSTPIHWGAPPAMASTFRWTASTRPKPWASARLQVAATYAQLSRGKFEMAAIEALSSALLDLRRLAWDLSLFTSAEFGFVALPPEYTTGSSIMPNKRNPDVIELLRATYASAAAARSEIEQLLSLPSGYHRDLQFSKGAIVHAFGRGLGALALLPDLLRRLQWNPDRMRAALEPSMYATDLAVDMARQGMPFREAYKQAADPSRWAQGDPEASLAARVSPGASGDPGLESLRLRLEALG